MDKKTDMYSDLKGACDILTCKIISTTYKVFGNRKDASKTIHPKIQNTQEKWKQCLNFKEYHPTILEFHSSNFSNPLFIYGPYSLAL